MGAVAPAFDFAGITSTVGAPSFAQFARGGNHGRTRDGFVQKDSRRTKVVSAASPPRPCEKRKDGAPSAEMAHTNIVRRGGPSALRERHSLR